MRNLLFLLLLCAGCSSDCIYKNDSYCLTRTRVFQPGAKAHIISDYEIESSYMSDAERTELYTYGVEAVPLMRRWRLESDISTYPRLTGGVRVERAMYNLSLDELNRSLGPDSIFRTGSPPHMVPGRDLSYSTLLALAHLHPDMARKSLLRRVDKSGRITQDAEAGRGWPVTTDRMIWAIAAYEVYKVTGDMQWLDTIYTVIRNSMDEDLLVAFDPGTRLFRGGFSFSDRPAETHPRWMQQADIYSSLNLGTCVVHFQALEVLEDIAVLKGDVAYAEQCTVTAAWLREAINTLFWQDDAGFYGQCLYGRDELLLSPRNETLAQALCILWDVADARRATQAVRNVPSVDFGTSCFFPNIADAPSCYNDAIWPFVQAYWMLAAAKAGNEEAVLHSIGSIYRAALLFLTNYENMHCDTGDWFATEANSARMLGSVCANLAVVHRLLFGIRFDAEGMSFTPFVPWTMKAGRRLENFRYRDAVLDIRLKGFGSRIVSFRLDGVEQKPFIPATLTGRHTVEIRLESEQSANSGGVNLVRNTRMPSTPVVKSDSVQLMWERAEGYRYMVLRDGKFVANTDTTSYLLSGSNYGAWQVIGTTNDGVRSFASEPLTFYSVFEEYRLADYHPMLASPGNDFESGGYVEIPLRSPYRIVVPVRVEEPGVYTLRWRYAKGNNPTTGNNHCPVAMMTVDDIGDYPVVFPLQGEQDRPGPRHSNAVTVNLGEGDHTVVLEYRPRTRTTGMRIDRLLLDCLVVSKKE